MSRLSLLTKLEIIEYYAKEGATYEETSRKFSVGKYYVSHSLKNKCSLVKLYNSTKSEGAKAFVYSELAVINSELAKWYKEKTKLKSFRGVTQKFFKSKLLKILREFEIKSFKFTSKWMKEFVKKNNVTLKINKPRAKKGISNDTKKSKASAVIGKKEFRKTLKEQAKKGKIVLKTRKHKQHVFYKKNKYVNSETKQLPVKPKKQKISAKIEVEKLDAEQQNEQKGSNENTNISHETEKLPVQQQNEKQKISIGNKSVRRETRSLSVESKKQKISEENENVCHESKKLPVKPLKKHKNIRQETKNFSVSRKNHQERSTNSNKQPNKKPILKIAKVAIKQNIKTRKKDNIANKNKCDFLEQVGLRIKVKDENKTEKKTRIRKVAPRVALSSIKQSPRQSPKRKEALASIKQSPRTLVKNSSLNSELNSEIIESKLCTIERNRTRNRSTIFEDAKEIQNETTNNDKLAQLSTKSECKKIKQNHKVTSNLANNNDTSMKVPKNKNAKRSFCDESEDENEQLKIQESKRQKQVQNDNIEEQTEGSLYYDTIEKDNLVEFFCKNKRQSENQPKSLSDIKLISGSENVMQSQQPEESTTAPEPSTSDAIEELNVSWSELFPDIKRPTLTEELVDHINQINFQETDDVFKNLKIVVLPHGYIDECDNKNWDDGDEMNDEFTDDDDRLDGEEADDEFEDDDDVVYDEEIYDGFEYVTDGQSSQGQAMPPPNQIPQPPNSMQGGYRPPMAPNARPQHPRGAQPGGVRMPGGNPRPPMNQRAPGMRARAPMVRPRGAGGVAPMRGQMRPRMPQNGIRAGHPKPLLKRNPDQNNAGLQAKRKRVEVLTPSDKEDDDCQVIFTQPKNTGLPQIEHIQGASEAVDNTIMKLPDSITLSVRPPAPKSASTPQKSEAKAVANVLASRGITVTPSAKPKESPKPTSPTAMSLNGAVSIVAASKGSAKPADGLPTVDLTDDSPSDSANRNRPGLPYRCDLCPATYPNAMGLNKHRQTYHKTSSGMSDVGIPVVNLKQPGIMQKLSQLGISTYIPMTSAGIGGNYAIPIINTKNPGGLVSALDSTQIISLGPVVTIPRPSNNVKNVGKK